MADDSVSPNNRAIVFRGRPEKERAMPWTGKEFAQRHNKSLSPGEAKAAARQATAMVNSGADEGIAIATANKRVNKLRKRGMISDKQHKKTFGDRFGTDVDAATA